MESLGMSPGALPSGAGWGWGVWFSCWYVVSIDTGSKYIVWLKDHSLAQDVVLLSRWSLFCLFPPSALTNKIFATP